MTLVLFAGFGTYTYLATHSSEPTIVVYAYDALFGSGCGSPEYGAVFGAFASAHHVHFEVECPSGTLSTTLINEANAPAADLVIGLDEVTAPQAEAAHVLLPYHSPATPYLPPAVQQELSPDGAVTAYEWGYLGIDFCSAFANATAGTVAHSAFPEFAANSTWAKNLVVENPTTDITGEEFLLWEIAFATQVLHANWQDWWRAVAPNLRTSDRWADAFNGFTCARGTPQAVASYLTDPAYAAYYGSGGPPPFNSTASSYNGTEYGWRAAYGIGIVSGSANVPLDQQFIDWFLSPSVQTLLPTTEWEYPANTTIPLPPSFSAAPDPRNIVPLNDGLPPATIAHELPGWLDAWQKIEIGVA
ncbi:MAG: extracellular solute-binding protein [Thermoplasmata archaeon]|nr:extracellular solute-binding protein [Thermoplasmata archaeon]